MNIYKVTFIRKKGDTPTITHAAGNSCEEVIDSFISTKKASSVISVYYVRKLEELKN